MATDIHIVHSPEAEDILVKRAPWLLRFGTLLVLIGIVLLLWAGWFMEYTETVHASFTPTAIDAHAVVGTIWLTRGDSGLIKVGEEVSLRAASPAQTAPSAQTAPPAETTPPARTGKILLVRYLPGQGLSPEITISFADTSFFSTLRQFPPQERVPADIDAGKVRLAAHFFRR